MFTIENDCMRQAKIMQQVTLDTRGKMLNNGSAVAMNARNRVDVTTMAYTMTIGVVVSFVGLLYLLA